MKVKVSVQVDAHTGCAVQGRYVLSPQTVLRVVEPCQLCARCALIWDCRYCTQRNHVIDMLTVIYCTAHVHVYEHIQKCCLNGKIGINWCMLQFLLLWNIQIVTGAQSHIGGHQIVLDDHEVITY